MITITEMIKRLEEIKKEIGDAKIYIEEENDCISIQGIVIGEWYADKVKYVLIY